MSNSSLKGNDWRAGRILSVRGPRQFQYEEESYTHTNRTPTSYPSRTGVPCGRPNSAVAPPSSHPILIDNKAFFLQNHSQNTSRRRRNGMKNGFKVIDADAHMQDELAHWLDFVEPAYRERSIKVKMVEDVFGGLGGRRQVEVLPANSSPVDSPARPASRDPAPRAAKGASTCESTCPRSTTRPSTRSGAPKAACGTWTASAGTSRLASAAAPSVGTGSTIETRTFCGPWPALTTTGAANSVTPTASVSSLSPPSPTSTTSRDWLRRPAAV